MTALPSRFAQPGSKAEFDLMHTGAALMAQEIKRIARVCEYWKSSGLIKSKPALRAVRGTK